MDYYSEKKNQNKNKASSKTGRNAEDRPDNEAKNCRKEKDEK